MSLHLETANEFEVFQQLKADTKELAEVQRLPRTLNLLADRELALADHESSIVWAYMALHQLVCSEHGLCQATRYPCVWSGYILNL